MGDLSCVFCFGLMVLGVVHCAVLPVEKCNLEDAACLKIQFQTGTPAFMDGIPELGIDVLDVMDMDDVKFDLAGLKFTLKEGKLKGMKTSVIDDVKWDVKKKQMNVEFHLDASIKGHYTAGGRILILPITGDGRLTLKLKNVSIKFLIDYEMVKDAEGKEYVKPTKLNTDFDVKDNAHFDLTNLFTGNKQLSDAMLTFLNENWKQISEEFGRPMLESAANKLYRNIKVYFEKVPIADIATV